MAGRHGPKGPHYNRVLGFNSPCDCAQCRPEQFKRQNDKSKRKTVVRGFSLVQGKDGTALKGRTTIVFWDSTAPVTAPSAAPNNSKGKTVVRGFSLVHWRERTTLKGRTTCVFSIGLPRFAHNDKRGEGEFLEFLEFVGFVVFVGFAAFAAILPFPDSNYVVVFK